MPPESGDEKAVQATLGVMRQDAQPPFRGETDGGRAALAWLDRFKPEFWVGRKKASDLSFAFLRLQRADAIHHPPIGPDPPAAAASRRDCSWTREEMSPGLTFHSTSG